MVSHQVNHSIKQYTNKRYYEKENKTGILK
jgi:hypothetical protein